MDPLAEQMPEWSPYNYVFNNPMIFVDPDGRIPGYPQLLQWIGKKVGNVASSTSNLKSNINDNFSGAVVGNQEQSVSNIHKLSSASQKFKYDVMTNAIEMTEKVENFSGAAGDAATAMTYISGGTSTKFTGPVAAGGKTLEYGAKGLKHSLMYMRDGSVNSEEVVKDGAQLMFSRTINKAVRNTTFHPSNSKVDSETRSAVEAGINTTVNTLKLKDMNPSENDKKQ